MSVQTDKPDDKEINTTEIQAGRQGLLHGPVHMLPGDKDKLTRAWLFASQEAVTGQCYSIQGFCGT